MNENYELNEMELENEAVCENTDCVPAETVNAEVVEDSKDSGKGIVMLFAGAAIGAGLLVGLGETVASKVAHYVVDKENEKTKSDEAKSDKDDKTQKAKKEKPAKLTWAEKKEYKKYLKNEKLRLERESVEEWKRSKEALKKEEETKEEEKED